MKNDCLKERIFALPALYSEHRQKHPDFLLDEINAIKRNITGMPDEYARRNWLDIYQDAINQLKEQEKLYQPNANKAQQNNLLEALGLKKMLPYVRFTIDDYLNRLNTAQKEVAGKEILVDAVLDVYRFEREFLWIIPVLHVYLKTKTGSLQFRCPYTSSVLKDAPKKQIESHFSELLFGYVDKIGQFLVEARPTSSGSERFYNFINSIVVNDELKRL